MGARRNIGAGMTRYVMYLDGERAVLVEQKVYDPGRALPRTLRYVFVNGEYTLRGQSGMYPDLPKVKPTEIDRATFEEAWSAGA